MRAKFLPSLVLALISVFAPALASAQKEIVIWHGYRGDEKAAFEKVIQQFNQSHPNIKASTLAVPYDAYADKITAAVPRGTGYEWTAMSYQEKEVGNQIYLIYGLSLLLVYLVLAGQYESWFAPITVIVSVPLALVP